MTFFNDMYDWVCPHADNRTEREAPYSFSEYFLWRDGSVWPAGRENIHAVCAEGVSGVYSDRLSQWDSAKYAAAMKECGGLGPFPSRETVTAFLTAYYGKPMNAHALARGCNVGNGYPYWIIWLSEAGDATSRSV